MIDKFLKAKHWQIFMLTIGLPMLLQMAMMPMLFEGANPGLSVSLLMIITVVYVFGFFGWIWAIAIGLQTKVPADVKMKVRKFMIFLIFPLVYILFFSGFIISVFGGNMDLGTGNNQEMFAWMMGIIFPLHIFCMFCIFYCLYFVAKTFKTVELQREVKFPDFAGEFLLFWFFPIGIWIMQPKINQMVADKDKSVA